MQYRYIEDLRAEVSIPSNGILSRTLHNDEQLKVVLFAFAAGQELSEHTAATPAILHVLEGQIGLLLGSEPREARAGTWVWMAPQLPHSLVARTDAVALLLLIKQSR
ncbi:MAG: cupin domain-containing protein [Bryobacterales bacterium]|nr:cupin domain-containing protein [Bryobacteraceae bacterium]MDW8129297.1 cupin domain-containing protein [Bryobacterales bacterium]